MVDPNIVKRIQDEWRDRFDRVTGVLEDKLEKYEHAIVAPQSMTLEECEAEIGEAHDGYEDYNSKDYDYYEVGDSIFWFQHIDTYRLRSARAAVTHKRVTALQKESPDA